MAKDEKMIAEITNGMESIRLPSDDASNGDERMESILLEAAAEGQANVVAKAPPREELVRPFDVVRNAGPAHHPISFPPPIIDRGVRDNVLCYNQRTQRFIKAENVLFRDYSRDGGDADSALQRVERAFWPVPHKEKIKTIMGYVQICVVLKRCPRERDEDDDSSDDEDGEEDIVFQVTKEYVAIKVNYCDRMERMKHKHAEDPLKEISAMQLIGNCHPNVMGCVEVLFDGQNLNVVMPYCNGGDLFSYLQDSQRIDLPQPGLPEDEAKVLFRQMMSGLKHLHSKGICHRDISPENIMMNGEGCLIIDMGMCLRVPYSDPNGKGVTDITKGTRKLLLKPQGACGKLPYMSPEIYRNRDEFDGEAVDVWTVGTILFCMLSGNRSYETPHKTDPQFYWMTNGLTTLLDDWGVDLSDEAIDLLQGMLKVNPRDRLTIQEIENHPWCSVEKEPASTHSLC